LFIKKSQKPNKYFAFFTRISDLASRKSEQTKRGRPKGRQRCFLTIWYYSVALSVFIFVRLKSSYNYDLFKIFHMASNR